MESQSLKWRSKHEENLYTGNFSMEGNRFDEAKNGNNRNTCPKFHSFNYFFGKNQNRIQMKCIQKPYKKISSSVF